MDERSLRPLKILITVEFYYARGGGGIQEQARQIAEGLAARGHNVVVATSSVPDRPEQIDNVRIASFAVKGNLVRGIAGEGERYQRFLLDSNAEIVMNFAANVWTTDLAFDVLDRVSGKKVLSTPGVSKIGHPRYEAYYAKAYMNGLEKYDRIVYTSADYRDKLFGDQHGLGAKAVIIPNGAGQEFLSQPLGFREKFGIRTPYVILSVSNHFFAKGHDFIIQAFKKMNRRDATLLIVGERPFVHSWYSCWPRCKLVSMWDRRIQLLQALPRSWVVSAYQEADLFLFGSRVECAPLVMYESFASRTPFITTNVGNVKDNRDVVKIVSTPDEMAAVAEELLTSDAKRAAISERAYQLWSEQYTWDRIVDKYEALYQSLA